MSEATSGDDEMNARILRVDPFLALDEMQHT